MVLEIRLSNFYSIKDEIILDMRAAKIKNAQAQNLKNNIFSFNDIDVLKTAILYGANASGKSNIIKAIRFCNAMVFESHNHNENSIFNFKPFKFQNSSNETSTYFIRFVSNNVEYEYSFELTQTQIVTETLHYYPKGRIAEIFTRDERKGKNKKDKYTFQAVIKRPWDVVENTSDKTLFLSRASQMDRDIAKELFNYFNSTFILGYLNKNHLESMFFEYKSTLLQALKIADSDIVDIKIKKEKRELPNYAITLLPNDIDVKKNYSGGYERLKLLTYHNASPDIPFDFETEESTGTQNLFYIMLNIIDIIINGKILLIDEIDKSLHPEIIDYILNLFKASNKAQLICTTHNTSFLDLKKFRKDQIYFVNKKDDASTELYSLYDYSDFRENMDLEKAYLQGRFDAIPFVDDSFENLKSIIDE
ncbi:MAG: ATP-binding protein [Bacteroidales bacterium]|nr:ATP-binding protein [Bacteroidales bacterium]